jgi:transcriptional regulator with XRE-family HTH domain
MNLSGYLRQHEIKLADFAGRIGVTATALQRYLDGERRPRAAILERIHRATDGAVQPNDFFAFIKNDTSVTPSRDAA